MSANTPLTDRLDDLLNDEPSAAVAISKWRWHAQQMESDRAVLLNALQNAASVMGEYGTWYQNPNIWREERVVRDFIKEMEK